VQTLDEPVLIYDAAPVTRTSPFHCSRALEPLTPFHCACEGTRALWRCRSQPAMTTLPLEGSNARVVLPEPQTRNGAPIWGSPKSCNLDLEPQTIDPQPQIPNPRPSTLNSTPNIFSLKSQTLNPRPGVRAATSGMTQ